MCTWEKEKAVLASEKGAALVWSVMHRDALVLRRIIWGLSRLACQMLFPGERL